MAKMKVIISGGGTGGHIFPAIAIANAIKRLRPNAKFLFVGALGRMEMTKVPEAGFEIVGLPIMGLQRKLTFKNLKFPFMLLKSAAMARKIVKKFKPDIAIGVGGYASGPLLRAAEKANVPTLLQEQNSYAGLTNKILGKKARKICVAYDGMDVFFPKEKIILNGEEIAAGKKAIEDWFVENEEAIAKAKEKNNPIPPCKSIPPLLHTVILLSKHDRKPTGVIFV